MQPSPVKILSFWHFSFPKIFPMLFLQEGHRQAAPCTTLLFPKSQKNSMAEAPVFSAKRGIRLLFSPLPFAHSCKCSMDIPFQPAGEVALLGFVLCKPVKGFVFSAQTHFSLQPAAGICEYAQMDMVFYHVKKGNRRTNSGFQPCFLTASTRSFPIPCQTWVNNSPTPSAPPACHPGFPCASF